MTFEDVGSLIAYALLSEKAFAPGVLGVRSTLPISHYRAEGFVSRGWHFSDLSSSMRTGKRADEQAVEHALGEELLPPCGW